MVSANKSYGLLSTEVGNTLDRENCLGLKTRQFSGPILAEIIIKTEKVTSIEAVT